MIMIKVIFEYKLPVLKKLEMIDKSRCNIKCEIWIKTDWRDEELEKRSWIYDAYNQSIAS